MHLPAGVGLDQSARDSDDEPGCTDIANLPDRPPGSAQIPDEMDRELLTEAGSAEQSCCGPQEVRSRTPSADCHWSPGRRTAACSSLRWHKSAGHHNQRRWRSAMSYE
jgi:hypothetical protein